MEQGNIRIQLPPKFQAALKRKASIKSNGSKRAEARIIIMRDLIKDGLVRPSKIERIACGLD